jgi:hypothetical protein
MGNRIYYIFCIFLILFFFSGCISHIAWKDMSPDQRFEFLNNYYYAYSQNDEAKLNAMVKDQLDEIPEIVDQTRLLSEIGRRNSIDLGRTTNDGKTFLFSADMLQTISDSMAKKFKEFTGNSSLIQEVNNREAIKT